MGDDYVSSFLSAMPRKTSTKPLIRYTSKRRRRVSPPTDSNCHAYLFPKEDFRAGKAVDDRVARSIFEIAVTQYKAEIVRHSKKDIQRCCTAGIYQHNVLMAVNWHKPDNFGLLFITCYRKSATTPLSFQLPPYEHNAAIQSFIDAPLDQQPFANMSVFKKNHTELEKLLREDGTDIINLNTSHDNEGPEDDSDSDLDTKLSLVLRNLGQLQEELGTVLSGKRGKGKAREIKRVPSRLSTPDDFPSASQLIRDANVKKEKNARAYDDGAGPSRGTLSSRSSTSLQPSSSSSFRRCDDVIVLSDDEEA